MSKDPYEKQKTYLARKRDAGWRQVKIDLDPQEVEALDKARGKQSRSAFVKAAVMKTLDQEEKKQDWSRTEYGSIEAQVVGIARWNNKPALNMVERLSQNKFTCVLADDLANRIGPAHNWVEAWDGRRMLVHGELHYDSDGALRRADAMSLNDLPYTSVELRQFNKLDITDGKTVAEHISQIRESAVMKEIGE